MHRMSWACLPILGNCFNLQEENRRPPGYEDPKILASETAFTISEVEALYELFKKVSSSLSDDGVIHLEEFKEVMFGNASVQNIFADRVFELFDMEHNGVIGFGDFIRSLSIFHPNAPVQQKIDFAYHLYDLHETGYIEWAEVKEMLMSLMQENTSLELNEEQIDAIVDQTFEEADINKDGKIDQLEWQEMVKHHPATLSKMTLPQLKDISTQFPSFVFNSKVDDWQDASRRPNVDRSSR